MSYKEEILSGIKEKGLEFINELNQFIYENSPMKHNPVAYVKWVKADEVQANDYNPNYVAKMELRLLGISIDHDGYTQPVVTIYDPKLKKYIIIDGFHRYYVLKTHKGINNRNDGYLPVTVLKKDINDRIASTIRHNRARGKHSVAGMSQIVFKMIKNGWNDVQICDELGLEADELMRLKHISGVAKLFEDREFGHAWEESHQVKDKLKAQEKLKKEGENYENLHKNKTDTN